MKFAIVDKNSNVLLEYTFEQFLEDLSQVLPKFSWHLTKKGQKEKLRSLGDELIQAFKNKTIHIGRGVE